MALDGRAIATLVVTACAVVYRAWFLGVRARDRDVQGSLRILYGVGGTVWVVALCITNGLLPRPFGPLAACTIVDVWAQLIALATWQHATTLRFIALWRTQHAMWRNLAVPTRWGIPSNPVLMGAFMLPNVAVCCIVELTHGSLAQWRAGEACSTPPPLKALIVACVTLNFAMSTAVQWRVVSNDAFVHPPAKYRAHVRAFRACVLMYTALGIAVALVNITGTVNTPGGAVAMWWLAETVVAAVMHTAFAVPPPAAWKPAADSASASGGPAQSSDTDVLIEHDDVEAMVQRLSCRAYNLALDTFLSNRHDSVVALAARCTDLPDPPSMQCVRETLAHLREDGPAGLRAYHTTTTPIPSSQPPHDMLFFTTSVVLIHAVNLWVLCDIERVWALACPREHFHAKLLTQQRRVP